MGKTLILIDGHALAFRQYYALERTQMSTSEGTPTWAVYGFFKAIFDLLKNKELKADAIAVAFDVSHITFRTEKYSEYKSNREAMPDPMRLQMDLIYEGLKAFNIPIYTKPGFEADDVIGTISKQACDLGHKVFILTGDQDAFQLVDKDGCIKVIIPSKGELTEYNWNKIYEKLGVYPNQVIDYKGLRGDTSDCIPGIKGIGEKTAQKLLAQFGTLDEVIKNRENIKEKSIRDKICAGVEQAKLSQELATIIRDLDINFDFELTKVELPDVSQVTEFLKKMQFYTFIKNIDSILSTFDKNSEAKPTKKSTSVQLGFFTDIVNEEINKDSEMEYTSKLITGKEELNEMLNVLKKQSLICFKVYANIKNAVNSYIYGFGFAYNKDFSADKTINFCNKHNKIHSFYIPFNNTEDLEDISYTKNILKTIFENENIKKTTFDSKNQYNVLRNIGINVKGIIFDVMLASYVKDGSRNHNLDVQALEHINHAITPIYDEERDITESFENVPLENILDNTTDECASILELSKFWQNNLSKDELNITYNIEVPVSLVLADMEYNGVSVDQDYLKELTDSMNEKLCKLENDIYNAAGCPFNINSPKQVGDILFVKLGLKSKKKRGKTNFSTSAEVLEELALENDIARFILDYRKYAKLKSTYTEALPALIDKKDNRIHTTYNQTGTVTGRLSSSNPNLQNIPIRTEDGNKIRKAFSAQDKSNALILSADYSQIELRLLAHITQDKNLMDAFINGIDVHTLTASKVFEVPVDKVTKDMRRKAKAVNFGIIYGQSKYGLAKNLGIKNNEAEEFINKYFATYPKIKAYMEGTIAEVQRKGFVQTIFGRKRYLEAEMSSSNAMIREFGKRAAINQPIQGTAADLMKIAMIEFSKEMKNNNLKSKPVIQVHDELVVEVYKDELDKVKEIIKSSMELNQPLSVPLVVDIYTGESWKEQ